MKNLYKKIQGSIVHGVGGWEIHEACGAENYDKCLSEVYRKIEAGVNKVHFPVLDEVDVKVYEKS